MKSVFAFAAVTAVAGSAFATVDFEWATVGNAGNAADPLTGFGAVGYEYRIATTEVTNAQYAAFLNAVAATDPHSLYNTRMAGNFGGIERSGTDGSYTYTAQAGRELNPVTYVSWYDAVRFANWMTNGQGNGDTETGVYNFTGLSVFQTPDAISINRDMNNPNQFYLPTENEWYKAAYHDASAGLAGNYFLYAGGSDTPLPSDSPSDNPAGANYQAADGTYAASGSRSFPRSTNPFTDVGAYTDAASPYGTFDQNGNVIEWNETLIISTARGTRGGSWEADVDDTGFGGPMRSTNRGNFGPVSDSNLIGFRLASPIPAPGAAGLAAVAGLAASRRRRGWQAA